MNSGGATNALSHFECDPFDLLGNAPYSNPPKSSPDKGEKSRREQQIFNCRKPWIFDDGSLENQRQLPKCLLDFECCTFDHSDNSPCLFSSGFLSRNLLKNSLERKQERRQKIFDFEIFCVEEFQGESGGRNSQLLPKFRVQLVTTTSIRFHV